ncbi:hypothetical protein H2203_006568 [Taxawa tesnikishii (nom. ined.)]|nr:hypothetical protein H2203_006568 [Dothideales sp. JES 119]
MSAFFHARAAPELLPEHASRVPSTSAPPRKILHERSASDLNRTKPTIRLVDSDSDSPAVYKQTPFPRLPSHVLKPPPGSKSHFDFPEHTNVSASNYTYNKPHSRDAHTGLVPKPLTLKGSNRLSTLSNSTTTSQADTLINDSLFSPTSFRHSLDGTLRGTPTPFERCESEQIPEEDYVDPLDEPRQESPTIRPVPPSTANSSSSGTSSGRSENRQSAAVTALPVPPKSPKSPSGSYFDVERPPTPPRHQRRKSSSTLGCLTPTFAPSSSPFIPDESQESLPQSEQSPAPARPRAATENVVRYVSSNESINPQYATVRPPTGQSQSASSQWASDSAEDLPSLQIPKKRLHSASMGSQGQPWARQQWSSHLSTIASESDRLSRSNSHFSRGSGVSTIGTPSLPLGTPSAFGTPRRRTVGSTPDASSEYSSSPIVHSASDLDESRPGVMRVESAVPEPLFTSPSTKPLPHAPLESESNELDDTIGELYTHPLRAKRSGALGRPRSQSDAPPSRKNSVQSTTDTERWSQGSAIFPQWARQFYRSGGNYQSPATSKLNLSSQGNDSSRHARNASKRSNTGRSITSRLGTSHSNWTNWTGTSNWTNESPGSSHFLPSIFRPRTRPRANTDVTIGSETTRDSMAIMTATPINIRRPLQPLVSHPPSPEGLVDNRRHTASASYPRPMSLGRDYTAPPHLSRSRRLSYRLSAWRAPSFNEDLSTLLKSRGNRQILFFCLGFLCPLLWIAAAFLPLPNRPHDALHAEFSPKIDAGEFGGQAPSVDEEKAINGQVWGWEQERMFLKARWWRTLNRIMSVVGVAVVAAIIALAVVASRMP